MGRALHKSWRDGPGGKWTRRIKWYRGAEGHDVRLNILDESAEINVFPASAEAAQDIWERFLNDEADSLSILAEFTHYPPDIKTMPGSKKKLGR